MASVKRRPDSPFWVMCYSVNGKRHQRSSRTENRNKALRMALRLEGLSEEFAVGNAQSEAFKIVQEIAEAWGQSLVSKRHLQDFFDSYYSVNVSRWSAGTAKTFKSRSDTFTRRYPDATLGEITKATIIQHRDYLIGIGRSARTVRTHIKYLRMVFQTAVESGEILENPAAGISLPPTSKSVKRSFSLKQFKALLDATDGEWHRLILLAGLTGQRLRDCLNIDSSAFSDTTITFKRKKNKDYHIVPRHPLLIADDYKHGFPELSSLPLGGQQCVSSRFRDRILPLIGISQPYGENMGGNRKVTEYSFHSLRHMLSTELERLGTSQEVRMLIIGHEDRKISAGYTHADLSMAQKVIEKIRL